MGLPCLNSKGLASPPLLPSERQVCVGILLGRNHLNPLEADHSTDLQRVNEQCLGIKIHILNREILAG